MRALIRHIAQALLDGVGLVWLFLASYYELTVTAPESRIQFMTFLIIGVALGILWLFVDGYMISGFLKRSIRITSNAFDTSVVVEFADLFAQAGLKAIPVNDFFDSTVDDKHVSEKSLHGMMLKTYWGGHAHDWETQVTAELKDELPVEVASTRPIPGRPDRYAVGTTAKASAKGGHEFLCVAIARTDTTTLKVSASSDELNKALRGLLAKARITCSGHPLNIPLMGSGLARTGIRPNIIVDLILLAIFEESRQQKITEEIRIILPKHMRKIIDLSTIQKEWR